MRQFFLHTYDKKKSFDLNGKKALAAEPTGLGNKFTLSYKESEKGKHLVNVKPEFEPIKLKIYFNADGSDGYVNYKALMSFLAECGTSKFLFEYNDGVTDKFAAVVLQSAPKGETDEEGIFAEEFNFERQTYWFEQVEESFALKNTDAGKTKFPLGFPFGFFGKVFVRQQRIVNKFFVDAPITIKISGEIHNDIYLYISTLAGEKIAELALSTNNHEGTEILIEPTTKKIIVTDAHGTHNGYGLTDKTKQSFLYLPQGDYLFGSNLDDNDEGKIEISIKRFLLD